MSKTDGYQTIKTVRGLLQRVCASHDPLASGGRAALGGHDDIRRIVEVPRSRPEVSKTEIQHLAFSTPGNVVDEESALNHVSTMLNCDS
jgi:hypothetical protein